MWINGEKFIDLERRIADLEKSQLQALDMVKRYIEDSETETEKLRIAIDTMPEKLEAVLKNYRFDE